MTGLWFSSEGLTYGCYPVSGLDTDARVSYGNFATTAGDPKMSGMPPVDIQAADLL